MNAQLNQKPPTRKELRDFGLLFGTMIALLFGLLLPWLFEHPRPVWPWIVLGVFVVWALAAPTTLRLVFRVWMAFGMFMSRITTPLLMGLVFFLAVTPMGVIRRLVAPDPMDRAWQPDADSYRKKSEALPADRLERPF